MNQSLLSLVNLQKIDTEIRKEEIIIKETTDAVNGIRGNLSAKENTFAEEKNLLASTEKDLRSKERQLEDVNAQMAKCREKIYKITNQKELAAIDEEIKEAKKKKASYEEELLAIMERIDTSSKGVNTKEKEISQESKDAVGKLAESEKIFSEASKKLESLAVKKEEALKGVDASLFTEYRRIAKSKGDCAVAAMRDGICGGCHMAVPPKLANEVKKNDQINRCENCARILYYPDTIPADN